MKRTLSFVLAFAALSYIGICITLYFAQRSLIYFPQPRSLGATQSAMTINSGSEKIVVSVRRLLGNKAVIYFAGNAEDPSMQLAQFSKEFPDRAVFLMHYRGYGGSSGKPSQGGLFQDALTLYDLVSKTHPDVLIIGRSLGSGIAAYLASERKVERLVLVTPYASVLGVAQQQFPWLPIKWLLNDPYRSDEFAPKIKAKTLILIAQSDNVIPRSSTDELIRALPKNLISVSTLEGTDHNSIAQHPNYFKHMKVTD
jgi:uncharacterized protein